MDDPGIGTRLASGGATGFPEAFRDGRERRDQQDRATAPWLAMGLLFLTLLGWLLLLRPVAAAIGALLSALIGLMLPVLPVLPGSW